MHFDFQMFFKQNRQNKMEMNAARQKFAGYAYLVNFDYQFPRRRKKRRIIEMKI
jgi:hypothetical protein